LHFHVRKNFANTLQKPAWFPELAPNCKRIATVRFWLRIQPVDAQFSGEKIRGVVRFASLHPKMGAGLTLAANPVTGAHLTVMLGMGSFCSLRAWNPGDQQKHAGRRTSQMD